MTFLLLVLMKKTIFMSLITARQAPQITLIMYKEVQVTMDLVWVIP